MRPYTLHVFRGTNTNSLLHAHAQCTFSAHALASHQLGLTLRMVNPQFIQLSYCISYLCVEKQDGEIIDYMNLRVVFSDICRQSHCFQQDHS